MFEGLPCFPMVCRNKKYNLSFHFFRNLLCKRMRCGRKINCYNLMQVLYQRKTLGRFCSVKGPVSRDSGFFLNSFLNLYFFEAAACGLLIFVQFFESNNLLYLRTLKISIDLLEFTESRLYSTVQILMVQKDFESRQCLHLGFRKLLIAMNGFPKATLNSNTKSTQKKLSTCQLPETRSCGNQRLLETLR